MFNRRKEHLTNYDNDYDKFVDGAWGIFRLKN